MTPHLPQDPRFKALYARWAETRRGVREILSGFLPLGAGEEGGQTAELAAYHALELSRGFYGLFVSSVAEVQGVPAHLWMPFAAFAEALVAASRAAQEALTLPAPEQLALLSVASSLNIQAGRLRLKLLPPSSQLDADYLSYLEMQGLPGLLGALKALENRVGPLAKAELAWDLLYAPLWALFARLPLPASQGPVAGAALWEALGRCVGRVHNQAMSRQPDLQESFDAMGIFPPVMPTFPADLDHLDKAFSLVLSASARPSHNIMLRDFCIFVSEL